MTAEINRASLVKVYAKMGHVMTEIDADRKEIRNMYLDGKIELNERDWALQITAELKWEIMQTPEYGLLRSFRNRKEDRQSVISSTAK